MPIPNKLNEMFTRFVVDMITRYRYIAVGKVVDIIRYKKTPEGQEDTTRPDFSALVSIKGGRQVVARIVSYNAGQVNRGTDPGVGENQEGYGLLRYPEINENVIIAMPFGNQNNPLIVGSFYGDKTTSDKIPMLSPREIKNIHISGVSDVLDGQGNRIISTEGHNFDSTTNFWSLGTFNKGFLVQNKSGTAIQLGSDNSLRLSHSGGAGIFIDQSGNVEIKGVTVKVTEL